MCWSQGQSRHGCGGWVGNSLLRWPRGPMTMRPQYRSSSSPAPSCWPPISRSSRFTRRRAPPHLPYLTSLLNWLYVLTHHLSPDRTEPHFWQGLVPFLIVVQVGLTGRYHIPPILSVGSSSTAIITQDGMIFRAGTSEEQDLGRDIPLRMYTK